MTEWEDLSKFERIKRKFRSYSLEKTLLILLTISFFLFIGFILGFLVAFEFMWSKSIILAEKFLDVQLNGQAKELMKVYFWKLT